jgi:hypothetical protein
MSCHRTTGQNHCIKVANKPSENMAKFKCLGMMQMLTNQNCIHEEIMSRLNLGNACYYELQNCLSSCLPSKHAKIKIHKTIVLFVLYGLWSLVSDVKERTYRLRVFENRVLRRLFGPKRDEVTAEWRKLHN